MSVAGSTLPRQRLGEGWSSAPLGAGGERELLLGPRGPFQVFWAGKGGSVGVWSAPDADLLIPGHGAVVALEVLLRNP